MGEDYTSVLAREFSADEGSFLLQLRTELHWDKAAFSRLTEAMLTCFQACNRHDQQLALRGWSDDKATVPRWLAEGFWYVSTFVRDWTTYPAWHDQTAREQDYYEAAYERLFALADWFFTGRCPYTNPALSFQPM